MNALAVPWHDGGPGPWILLFPLVWAAAVVSVVTLLRRGGRPWSRLRPGGPAAQVAPPEDSPLTLLGRRFAAGEIDEDEYWRRLSVLDEQFGVGRGGAR